MERILDELHEQIMNIAVDYAKTGDRFIKGMAVGITHAWCEIAKQQGIDKNEIEQAFEEYRAMIHGCYVL